MARAVADGFLEVKRDCCRWEIEAALCGMQSAPILALAQEDEEAGSWGNPRQAMPRRQEVPEVGERGMGKISATVALSWFLSSNQLSISSLESIWDKDRGSFLESTLALNEPYPITQGDALRQGLRLRCLIQRLAAEWSTPENKLKKLSRFRGVPH